MSVFTHYLSILGVKSNEMSWNLLPAEVVTADTIDTFKNRFDKYIDEHENELKYHVVADD